MYIFIIWGMCHIRFNNPSTKLSDESFCSSSLIETFFFPSIETAFLYALLTLLVHVAVIFLVDFLNVSERSLIVADLSEHSSASRSKEQLPSPSGTDI